MEQITNHIPLGIKALVAGIKLKEKMEYYFPKDIMEYENHFGIDIWEKMTEKYSKVLGKEKKEVYKANFTRKEKKQKYNKLEIWYLKLKLKELDDEEI